MRFNLNKYHEYTPKVWVCACVCITNLLGREEVMGNDILGTEQHTEIMTSSILRSTLNQRSYVF